MHYDQPEDSSKRCFLLCSVLKIIYSWCPFYNVSEYGLESLHPALKGTFSTDCLNAYLNCSVCRSPSVCVFFRLSNAYYLFSRIVWTRHISLSTPYINTWSSSAPTGRQQACGSSSCTTWPHCAFPSSRHQHSFTWSVMVYESSELNRLPLLTFFESTEELLDEKSFVSVYPDLLLFSVFVRIVHQFWFHCVLFEISSLQAVYNFTVSDVNKIWNDTGIWMTISYILLQLSCIFRSYSVVLIRINYVLEDTFWHNIYWLCYDKATCFDYEIVIFRPFSIITWKIIT
jgi:hypothetical protein